MAKKEILVVDDEATIRNMMTLSFSRAGYGVQTAESGEEAVDILKDVNIDVMFLDLNLPGMNGIELCRRIRKDRPMAIMYAVTGFASLFELADCRDAGFEDYFIKPVNMKTLISRAGDAFEKVNRWRQNQ